MDKELKIPNPDIEKMFLNPTNLFIRNIPFESLEIKEDLLKRFKDSDVISFYKKHP